MCNKQGHRVVECPNLRKQKHIQEQGGNHNANAVFQQDEDEEIALLATTTVGKSSRVIMEMYEEKEVPISL